jgi:uncharacterized protein
MESTQFNKYVSEIVKRLQISHPWKIILFGSHAWGDPSSDSDIDLLVVTDSNIMPRTFKEKSDLYLQVANCLADIREKVSVDLIVHTKKMHERFMELGSCFAREIAQNGKVLYEAGNP